MKPSRFCRVCATKVNETCEIENNPTKPELPLLLKRYVPEFDIEVENACLCYDCVNTLYKIHNFKRKCLQTEEDVRLHIRQHPDVKAVNLKDIFSTSGQTNNVALETTNQTINNKSIECSSKNVNNTPVVTTQYLCTLCRGWHASQAALEVHKQKSHFRVHYQCDECSRDFVLKNEYKSHLAYHKTPNAVRYMCEICDFVYVSGAALKYHNMSKHMSDDHKPFMCEVCGKRFAIKTTLIGHMRTHTGEKPYKCSTCTYASTRKSMLSRHVGRKHSTILETTNQTINNEPIESSSTNDDNPPVVTTQYMCKLCRRCYASKKSLEIHKTAHSRERYQCDKCSRNFILKNNYEIHLAYHKTPNAGRHMCKTCNFVYSCSSVLKKHKISKHMSDDDKPFACEVCGKRFVIRTILIDHMRTHTGERPYKCTSCDYTSTAKGLLNKHIKTMHRKDCN